VIELLIKAIASYLVGSIVGSLAIGRAIGVDIRTLGSGNAGGTNALRTQGKAFALAVVLIDVAKGWAAAAFIARLTIPGVGPMPDSVSEWLPAVCGAAAILGHVYPLWHGLRGGKGAATLLGALIGLDALLLVPVLATWLVALALTGFVSVASMAAAIAVPIVAVALDRSPELPLVAFGVFAAVLLAFTHRANLARIRTGTEPRARRVWLLGLRR
jgi:acyl phosphate:glycerol-3-phosphate acyltransferase